MFSCSAEMCNFPMEIFQFYRNDKLISNSFENVLTRIVSKFSSIFFFFFDELANNLI